MKTFEEKFTAWIDGKLDGHNLAAFERELETHDNAQAEKAGAVRLGNLLREHGTPPELRNADFFNHQLMERLEGKADGGYRIPDREEQNADFRALARMAFGGAGALVLAAALYFAWIPGRTPEGADEEYLAKVLNPRTDDPGISATAYYDDDNKVTVLWLNGLDYIPENYKLK